MDIKAVEWVIIPSGILLGLRTGSFDETIAASDAQEVGLT